MRAAFVGLAVNVMLGGLKIAAGIAARSMALIADAVNSLGDVFTSIVVISGLWYAQKPPNPRHPYGHTRAESIAALCVAMIIAGSALAVAVEAIGHGPARDESPPGWTLWIAAANAAVKEGLFRYKSRIGRRTRSSALLANAWDHRNDALSSLAVLLGLATVKWGGSRFAWVDLAAALAVVAMILWSAAKLFRNGAGEIMDEQADESLLARIRESAGSVPDVRAVEKLLVRKSGLEFFVDIHVEVDARMTVAEGHRVGHRVKDRIVEDVPSVRDVLVHLEPHLPDRGDKKNDAEYGRSESPG